MPGAPPRRPPDVLLNRLAAICGPAQVLTDPQTLSVYARDASGRRHGRPAVAVLPGSPEQVAAVVRACAETGVGWVARGAGTGWGGGAVADAEAVLIVLTRLRAIRTIDLSDRRVRVEAGAPLSAVQAALAPDHRIALDPYSSAVATVGGLIATDADGPGTLRHGTALDQLLGVEVVLADGRSVRLDRSHPGLDLFAGITSTAGHAWIVVTADLLVAPVPEATRTAVACFSTLAEAVEAAAQIDTAALDPTALELVDAVAIRAAGRAVETGYRADAAAALLIEFAGALEPTLFGLERAVALCGRAGALDIRIAVDAGERATLWQVPTALFTAMRRIAAGFRILDLAVTPTRLADALAAIASQVAGAGLPVALLVHAGEGRVRPVIGFDPAHAASRAAADRLTKALSEPDRLVA